MTGVVYFYWPNTDGSPSIVIVPRLEIRSVWFRKPQGTSSPTRTSPSDPVVVRFLAIRTIYTTSDERHIVVPIDPSLLQGRRLSDWEYAQQMYNEYGQRLFDSLLLTVDVDVIWRWEKDSEKWLYEERRP